MSGTGVFIDINVPDSYPGREERMWPRDAHASLQTSGSVTSLPIWQLGILCEFYTLRGREEIYSFLQARHHLVPLLVDAYFQIAKYFGPDPDIILEVFTDPEGDRHKELFAFIQTPLPPQDAIAGLRQLDHGWWLEEVAAAEGNLSISLEFK
ncbi:MAG: hypothetical protein Q8O86_09890 [Dehalococcoidia bacterium]|nr:hypothetical protein [Dehalococcoidia bacterium]